MQLIITCQGKPFVSYNYNKFTTRTIAYSINTVFSSAVAMCLKTQYSILNCWKTKMKM